MMPGPNIATKSIEVVKEYQETKSNITTKKEAKKFIRIIKDPGRLDAQIKSLMSPQSVNQQSKRG